MNNVVIFILFLICKSLVHSTELEEFEFITVISTSNEDEMTVSQAAEQQNEVPDPNEQYSAVSESNDYTESPLVAIETPSMEAIANNQGQSIFNMWLHLNQGYNKQKSKERFCIDKMAECLADPSSDFSADSQNVNNIPIPDFLVPESNNQFTVIVDASATQVTTVARTKATEDVTKATEEITESVRIVSTTTVKNVKCNIQNFMRLRECCPHTPGDLITGAIVFACSEGSPVVPRSILREYSLNLGQGDDRSINFTSTRTFSGQLLGGSVCFVDCIFKKRAMVNIEGDLDYSMIRYHLTKAVSGAWQLAMLQAIDDCGKAIKYVHPERKMYRSQSLSDYCLVHPFLLFQCIRKSLILACVAMSIQEKHPECADKLENLKACDIFKIPAI